MTVLEELRAISPYPIPAATLTGIAEGCGLEPDSELKSDTPEAKRATAIVCLYLAAAPSISQNGISFSFGSEERRHFRARARALLREIGDDPAACGAGVRYGYRGEDF